MDKAEKIVKRITEWAKQPWTLLDEAIHRGGNYAEANLEHICLLRKDEGMPMFAILKNAYQEGFLHGFEHKFDNTNYERQTDMVSECPKPKEKKMQIIEDGYGGNHDPKPSAEDIAHRLRKAYNLLYAMNNETTDMDGYFHGVEETLGYVAEALDMVEGIKDES